jgi:hypothetical protein
MTIGMDDGVVTRLRLAEAVCESVQEVRDGGGVVAQYILDVLAEWERHEGERIAGKLVLLRGESCR